MFASALSVFCFPPALLKSSVDNGTVPLTQVLSTMLGLLAKDHDIHVTDFFLLIIGLSKPSIDRQAEIRNGRAAGGVAKLRVSRQISNENDFIEPHHRRILPFQPQPLGRLFLRLSRSETS